MSTTEDVSKEVSEEEELEGYEPASETESESQDEEGQEAFENYEDEADKILIQADDGVEDVDGEEEEISGEIEETEVIPTPTIPVETIGGIRVPPWKLKEFRSEVVDTTPTFTPIGPSVKLRISPLAPESLKKSESAVESSLKSTVEPLSLKPIVPLKGLEPITSETSSKLKDLIIGESGIITDLDKLDLESLKEEDPEYYRAVIGEPSIDDLLKKGKAESDQFFNLRSAISRKLANVKLGSEGGSIDPRTCVALGSVIANKVANGVTYNERLEKTLKFILSKI